MLTSDIVAFLEWYGLDSLTLCREPYLTSSGIVVVYLHHGSEDVVIKLASKLRDYHFIDTKRLTDGYAVYLKCIVVFFNTSCIDTCLLLNSPALSTEESTDEVNRR